MIVRYLPLRWGNLDVHFNRRCLCVSRVTLDSENLFTLFLLSLGVHKSQVEMKVTETKEDSLVLLE